MTAALQPASRIWPSSACKSSDCGVVCTLGRISVADLVAHGSDQAATQHGTFTDVLEQVGGGRLAVGSRHAAETQLERGVMIKRPRQGRHRRAGAGDLDVRHLVRHAADLVLDHHRGSPARDGLPDVIVAVHALTRQRHKSDPGVTCRES